MHEIEVFLMVDEQGNAVVSLDQDNLGELYNEDGNGSEGMARRIIILNVSVPPMEPLQVAVIIPPEPQSAAIKVITKQ